MYTHGLLQDNSNAFATLLPHIGPLACTTIPQPPLVQASADLSALKAEALEPFQMEGLQVQDLLKLSSKVAGV